MCVYVLPISNRHLRPNIFTHIYVCARTLVLKDTFCEV